MDTKQTFANSNGFTITHARDTEPMQPGAWQTLYKVTPAVKYKGGETEYVLVSAIDGFAFETYIFPSNRYGKVIDWGELPGSFQGGNDHEAALYNLNHYEPYDF